MNWCATVESNSYFHREEWTAVGVLIHVTIAGTYEDELGIEPGHELLSCIHKGRQVLSKEKLGLEGRVGRCCLSG